MSNRQMKFFSFANINMVAPSVLSHNNTPQVAGSSTAIINLSLFTQSEGENSIPEIMVADMLWKTATFPK